MTVNMTRFGRPVGLLIVFSLLASCGLPRSGPTREEIFSSSVAEGGSAYIVTVDDRVARAAAPDPSLSFNASFLDAGVTGSDTIRAGDTLGLSIWENVDDGLLANEGLNATTLEEVQVDGDGFIFVPYAGRIKASGNTPEGIRRLITDKLAGQTPDPQILVRRLAGDGSTVSLIGGVGAQGVYAIERPTRTLTAMLARAGGVVIPPEIAQVTVIRGGHTGRIWLQDLYNDPRLDIALRGGDRILVEEDQRSYTAMGATGQQTRVRFTTQTITAIEAIATVGGLNPNLADPTGIFVLRNEPAEVASAVLGRQIAEDQRMAYVIDLTRPEGVFIAKDFQIRDGDTVYVTEAPYARFSKVLSSLIAPINSAASVATLAE